MFAAGVVAAGFAGVDGFAAGVATGFVAVFEFTADFEFAFEFAGVVVTLPVSGVLAGVPT